MPENRSKCLSHISRFQVDTKSKGINFNMFINIHIWAAAATEYLF